MNAKEFYEFQLNDKTSTVGRQDKEEIVMLMEKYYEYKVKTCNKPAVSGMCCPACGGGNISVSYVKNYSQCEDCGREW